MIRMIVLFGMLVAGGCAVTVPYGNDFSDALLNADSQDEAVLFVYSAPESPKHLYKYIFIDGDHAATITTDTFARITLQPGRHRVRILQHGYQTPDPWIIKYAKNERILAKWEATTDIQLEPGGVHFLRLGSGKRQIYIACADSRTATLLCTEEVNGLLVDEVPRAVALSVVSTLREVCKDCE